MTFFSATLNNYDATGYPEDVISLQYTL